MQRPFCDQRARATELEMNPGRFLSGYSLEITARDLETLTAVRDGIAPQAAISITLLPGDEVEKVVQAAIAIRRLGFVPVPHISARRMRSTEELASFLGQLRDAVQIDRAFVIAGDLSRPRGPYEDALAVIRSGLLARHGIRRVGIAGYPEGHPQIPRERLSLAMKEKLAALMEAGHIAEIVTQFAFDADAVAAWVAHVRAADIHAPIRIGIAGPATAQSLLRYAARCGVAVSVKVMAKYGVPMTRLLSGGTPDLLVRRLSRLIDSQALGAVTAHLYPFGGLAKLTEWLASVSEAHQRVHEPASSQN
jgi:methylenetetrahydrofolate reductase (NADH)